jgi:DNA-binding transcriptional regulator YdaS (Cro superfamily)
VALLNQLEVAKLSRDAGVRAAIKAAGGIRALARIVGVAHPAVFHWTSIPIRHLLKIEEATGIPRERLRPDIFKAPRPKK